MPWWSKVNHPGAENRLVLGERGVLVLEGEDAEHLPAPAIQAVDTTGAGDAFIGSLAVFLAEGQPVREAARRANAAAALSVTRLGAQSAFPRRSEVEALLGSGGSSVSHPAPRC